ncbi:nucleotidyltransferase domain-containing protein [Paenibacillus mendelii]|uniref:Nucleotidyltransferase domain-containing protein n=1 Tax=Paenibacillus mendelii TaxID=206163 RepID=A0ABV6J741_9BACL|nr:nucleotidyltransferase domain-containing protein [Paenibacillus mendelii]MCQ6561825.1 nucleotidyltransferase domain-containing protein [Paenibacillus mendelii]
MNETSKQLLKLAHAYSHELSQHEVIRQYWGELSLVLKGSVSRGNSDRYSDIDFVFFCEEDDLGHIHAAYHRLGLTDRTDGVFIPIGEWAGHYHFESYATLQGYFDKHDFPQVWEFQQSIPIHDPRQRFSGLIERGSHEFMKEALPFIKNRYLDLHLTLDWMRHPLRRGDSISAHLHAARIVQELCRIAYLLDGKSYPHDKWVSTFLPTTRFGEKHGAEILAYLDVMPNRHNVTAHAELAEYACYAEAEALIGKAGAFIREHYGEHPWIEHWYNYV